MEQKFSQASGLYLAGLGSTDQSKWIFRRSEVKELWDRLETSSKSVEDDDRLLYISGPPGTGKSTAVWMWAGSLVATSKLKVVWVHLGRAGLVQYVSITSEATLHSTLNCDEWVGFFKSNARDADVVILDGLIESEKKIAMSTLLQWQKNAGDSTRHLIFVASEQLKLGGEDVRQANRVSVCSWTLTDAFEACANDQFWDQVSVNFRQQEGLTGNFMTDPLEVRRAVVSDKFSMCGGSARWLFGMDFNEAKSDIDRYLERVENSNVLSSALRGAVASTAVNHVMGLEKDEEGYVRIICSIYIQRQLSNIFRVELIQSAKNLASTLGNPAFAGLVLEADFDNRVMTSSCLKVKDRDEADVVEAWDAGNYVEFSAESDLQGGMTRKFDGSEARRNKKEIKVGTWLLPKWNQGCYDAVQLLENNTLRFVQVTMGKTHSLRLQFAVYLIETLVALGFKIETIDFVFLGPEGSEPPKLTNVEGDLRPWGEWTVNDVRYLWLPKNAESV
jgi:hypothetical protein